MMALFYARVLASQGELETEMRGHLATAAELRRATEEAERAGAAKADFLAKMSHELRTPLNAVIGYSQILLEDAADEQDEETASDLERIHSAGHHLLRLVNEVLDLSKIEAGKMELHQGLIEIAPMIADAHQHFSPAASRAGNTIAVQCADEIGAITCDGIKLRQALFQILDNAVKFTHGGHIIIGVERLGHGASEQLAIWVRDTGIGISATQLPTLFEHFTVGDDSSASKYGGTGLGLALGRKLCRLMGGDILVESQEGRGSTFTIRVPVAPPVDGTMPAHPRSDLPAAAAEPATRFGARLAAIASHGSLSPSAAHSSSNRESMANHA